LKLEINLLPVNFRKGRALKPDVIVIHIQEGTQKGTDEWFRNPAAKVSAHYGVALDGSVVQWVANEDTAQHAGNIKAPTAAIVKERRKLNPNSYSLGIECEGLAKNDPPDGQLEALAELVEQLAAKYSIPLTRRHVIGHREIRADKTCPGKIDVDDVVKRALRLAKLRDEQPA